MSRKSKISIKRALSILTAAIMLVAYAGFVPEIGMEAHAASTRDMINAGADVLQKDVNAKGAQLVYMGDRDWYVIGYEGTGVAAGRGEISFLSKDNIKLTPFDKNYDIVYNSSNLKKDIEAYINEKFSAEEKSAVAARDLSAVTISENENCNWWASNYQTVDSVVNVAVKGALLWPLSAKEAVAVNANIRKTGGEYWLRSLGMPEDEEYDWYGWDDVDIYTILPGMAIVDADGNVQIQDDNTSYWKGMRPAFKLKKSDVVLTTAPDGKPSTDEGRLTPNEESYSGNKWKLTLRDESRNSFHVDPCDVELGESGSITVKYVNAKPGENEYISAIIKGADGRVKQYGRVAKVSEASGTATIKGLPTDSTGKASLPEGDKLYVFNEQFNGADKTDFSSALTEIRFTGHDWIFDDIKYDTRTGAIEASYHCSIDGNHFKTIEKGEYTTERTDPTCEEPGKEYQVLSISAEDSLDGKAHRKSKYITDYADQLGHQYTHFFGFRWTGDATSGYKKAEAIFACDRDYSHKTYVEAVVTPKVQEPTCTAIGRTLYQATLSADKSPDGEEHWDAKYAKAKKKLGHDWGEATYEWSADNKTVTAKHVCKRDDTHVETETVETETTNITKAPTCKATGVGDIKTKPFTDEAFQEQTKTNQTLPVDPDAHEWNDGEKQGDPNSCGGYVTIFTCKLCGEVKEEVIGGDEHQWSSDYKIFVDPTCTEMGDSFKKCEKCGIFDLEDPKPLDPIGHKWKFEDFTWTGDAANGYEKAVANYVCENDPSHTMTANAEIAEEVVDPTCRQKGKTVYTASVSASDSPDDKEHSESKDAEATETVPHEWEYNSMKWTGNETDGYTKAVAEYKCKFGCEQKDKVEAKITEETAAPDCENDGKIIYTATVKAEDSLTGEEHTDSNYVKTADALGHDWHFKDMLWTGDVKSGFTKAQAKYVCENNESHEKLAEAKITSEVTAPTCLEEGYTMYKAVIEPKDSLNGLEYMDVNYARIKDATGHAWKLKGFTWTAVEGRRGFTARADYVCQHDGSHAESIGANMRIEKKDATCEEPGGTLYKAIVEKENSLTDVEVTEDKFVKASDPVGHKWGDPKYTWSSDNKTVTAEAVCKNDSGHVKKETVKTTSKVTKKATCKAAGTETYTAVFKDSLFKTQTKEVETSKTKTHTWGSWKVTKKATVNAKGKKTRVCKVCGKKQTKSIGKLKTTGTLIARATASGEKALKYKWTKVKNVSGYDVFMSRCNYKGKTYTPKKVKTIKGNKTFTWTQKKLKKNTSYKAYVKAYTLKNGKKKYVKTSPMIHVLTGNERGSLTNPRSVSVNKAKVTVAKGKTYQLKAKVTKVEKNLKFPDTHAARVRYLTTNKKIATVSKNGKIKAVGKGTCTVYAYAANGIWKTCKVTVK